MAQETREVGIKLTLDSTSAQKSVGEIKNELSQANLQLEQSKKKFGEVSDEVKQAKEEVDKLNKQLAEASSTTDAIGKKQPFESLNKQLKEATIELSVIQNEFGETSIQAENAANKVALIKQEIANAQDVSINLSVESTSAENSVEQIKNKLSEANIKLEETTQKFEQISDEVKQSENQVQKLNTQLAQTANAADGIGQTKSFELLNEELNQATQELNAIEKQFGKTSIQAENAAKKVALIKDEIADVKDVGINLSVNSTSAQQSVNEIKSDIGDVKDVDIKLSVDANSAQKSVGQIRSQLAEANTKLEETKNKFGEMSNEAKEAEKEVQRLNDELNNTANASDEIEQKQTFVPLKRQLKEATQELFAIREQFGETSVEAINAAKRVAQIRDEIGDAKALADGFNPDAKFKALGSAIQGVTGGFAALQGAQALFGNDSKELQETLVKVQGALALSQGVDAILEAKDSFKVLKAVAIDAFKGIKAAIGSTGIGLLVVALGAIVANWDNIKEAVSGVSEEQKKLNAASQKNLDVEKEKLSALDSQDNVLKLQGKSEKEILNLKIAQVDATIKATEAVIENNKITTRLQVESAKRNADFLKSTIDFFAAPVKFIYKSLLSGVDLILKAYSKITGTKIEPLSDQFFSKIEEGENALVKTLFDPKKVQEEAKKVEDENKKSLDALKNQKAGLQLQIKSIDDEANKKSLEKQKATNDEIKKNNEELEKRLQDIKNQYAEESLKNDDERAKKKIANDLKNDIAEINKLKASDELKRKLIAELQAKAQLETNAIDDKINKEKEAKQVEFENELADLTFQTRLAGIKDAREKERVALDQDFFQRRQQILNNTTKDSEEKQLLIAQLLIQEQNAKNELEAKFAQEDTDKKIAKLEKQIQDETLAKEVRLQAITDEQALLDQQYANKLISEEQYNEATKKLSKDRIDIDVAEAEARAEIAATIGDIAVGLVNLIKSTNEKSKGLAIASLIVEQAAAVAKIITTTQVANAGALGTPQAIATSGASAIPVITANNIKAGISIASAVASVVKGIQQIKSASPSGGGGGSAPSVSGGGGGGTIAPPLPPQQETTLLNQNQVNEIGSATARAYVVESDISGNQERIQRINRASRIS